MRLIGAVLCWFLAFPVFAGKKCTEVFSEPLSFWTLLTSKPQVTYALKNHSSPSRIQCHSNCATYAYMSHLEGQARSNFAIQYNLLWQIVQVASGFVSSGGATGFSLVDGKIELGTRGERVAQDIFAQGVLPENAPVVPPRSPG